ncbi:MAG: Fic family protein [Bacteroidales bacterium]|nr:Fic family protein [Bacteroidales bacterium]
MKYPTLSDVLEVWQSMQPLSARDHEMLGRRFTIDFNYNSNHIEGNTLTYGQTEILLLFGKIVGEAKVDDVIEMKASDVGLKMMKEEARLKEMPLNQSFIRTLHKTLLREDYTVYRNLPGGMMTSYVIHAGQYKTRPNSVITRYGDRFEYASPEETPALMNDLVNWYNEEEKRGTLSPVELAALFHYRFIRIHPFEDGNGRIARLMVNFILFRHGYPMIVVRSRKKQEYLDALHKTDLKVGSVPSDGANARIEDIIDFLKYFQKLMKEEIEFNIRFLTERGENVWWFDGERINFRSETTSKILQMFRRNAFVSIQELMDVTGINKSAVNKQLKLLREKKYIAKNENTGEWRVIITPSI